MVLDPRAIHIYTDGSCYQNPGGEAGCAAIVRFPDSLHLEDEQIVDFGCAESSNNRMELMACIKSLEWLRERRPWPDVTRVQIVSDSTYVTENVSFRARSWKKNKWRNRYGKPMANDDLWDALLAAQTKAGIRVDFVWQPGKKSTAGKAVDMAAKAAAERGGIDEDRGYRPGAVCRSMVRDGVAQPFPAKGQSAVIRPYAKKIMFRGENRISFNVFVETAQAYEGKFHAFAGPVMDRHNAVKMLADIFEELRPRLKDALTKKDEADLFNIANNFEIRHRNERQKRQYDKALWLSWMFYFYVATLHFAIRRLAESGTAAHSSP